MSANHLLIGHFPGRVGKILDQRPGALQRVLFLPPKRLMKKAAPTCLKRASSAAAADQTFQDVHTSENKQAGKLRVSP